MHPRAAWSLLVTALLACDPTGPDTRGTLGNALQVQLQVDGVSDELLRFQGLGALPIKLELLGARADADARIELAVPTNQALVVVPARGEAITYQGTPLRAEYYHLGRLLVVYQGTGDVLVIHNFVEPIRWYTVLRASL